MHPAPSIILFTVLSGLGFGMMTWLGAGATGVEGWVAFVFCALALALASGGLLFSTFHLGNPQRAWRAFSQWRTSWLSREGVLAVATLAAFAVYGALWSFGGQRAPFLGALAAALSLLTVFSTSMIYAQLRAVPRWHDWTTPALFVATALAGGAALSGAAAAAAAMMVIAGAAQAVSWRHGDGAMAASGSSPESATGLGPMGRVRLLEAPHSGPTWLTREMVHVVARRRARALRIVAMGLGFVLPALILGGLDALPLKHGFAALAILSHFVGVLAARWLFFAEAEHVVGLYYGRR